MAQTTFSGPVRSEGGFQTITIASGTGAVTVTSTLGAATSVTSIATGTLNTTGAVIMANLPTSDPTVAGQLWNDTGTVKVSAG